MSDLSIALELFQIPPMERSTSTLERLVTLTKGIKFFTDISEKSSTLHYDCCGRIRVEEYAAGQYIFRQLEKGDFFCIILKGSVTVQLLKLPVVEYLKANHQVTSAMKDQIAKGLRMLSDSPTEDEEPPSIDERILYNIVATLGIGASFGELSLLKRQPRAASIQCEEACSIAVLSLEDYNDLLRGVEERRLAEKTSFMAGLPLFRGWTKNYLEKTSYYFVERTYRRRQIVFKESDPADYFYIIKDGEFKVSSTQTTKNLRLSPDKSSLERLMRRQASRVTRLNVRTRQLVIRGVGELLADEELVKDVPHTATCECVSASGKLLVISQKDMRQRVTQPQTWEILTSRFEFEERWMVERIKTLEEVSQQKSELPSLQRVTPDLTSRRSRTITKMQTSKTPDLTLIMKDESLHRQTKTLDYTNIETLRHLVSVSKPKKPVSISPPRALRPSFFKKQSSYRPPPNFFATPTAALASRVRNLRHNVR
jgi:CRP-like cAMP-binding protein